ncbi:MAG: penicillin-binding protein [bacterium]
MPIPQIQHDEYAWRQKQNKQHKKGHFTSKFFFLKLFFVILVISSLGLVGGFFWLSKDLPNPNGLMNREVAQSTKIYDRKGETILYELHGDQKRTLVDLKQIPDNVKNATIAIEDKDFYHHGGFSVWAIFRTIVMNVLKGQKAGASTLTQQFVKNAILTTEKSYTRKLKELILAYRLEQRFSKDEVLQMYLNEIPYGSTAYGVESASLKYFGKNVKDTNLSEAAILAALPQAPSRYSPYGNNKDLLIARQHYILDQMVDQGYITSNEAEEAKSAKLEFKQQSENILAPHFVMYLKDLLEDNYDAKTIEQGGLKIISTIDLDKQKIAEDVVKTRALKNAKNFNATNASLVSIDPKTGQILALVGSRDYFDTQIDGQVNIALANRQPGSSFKPIVYTAAFIKGYTPDTILYDVVTNFSTDPDKKYEPHNYDLAEHGPITIRKALAGSLNIPAVKAMYLTGINTVMDFAKQLGYTTLNDKDRFGLSLVLGGGEVKLLEHVNAYATFARDGRQSPITGILKIEDRNGKTLEEYKDKSIVVYDGQIARQTNSILSDNNARSYIFGTKNYLTLGDRPVAAKTGTTNDYKDAWTIGYTPSIVTGVWVGNNDNSSMSKGADGSVVAAPIWNEYMKKVLIGTPIEEFKKPEIIKTDKGVLNGVATSTQPTKIDRASGLLATNLTPESYIKNIYFSAPHDILYYVDKDNPQGPLPKNPSSDPQFLNWEAGVKTWALKNNLYSTSTEPTESDNLHIAENLPIISFISPIESTTLLDPILTTSISVTATRGIKKVEYYLDGKFLDVTTSEPFSLTKNISFINNGQHELKANACDDIDNCTTTKIQITTNIPNNTANETINISITNPPSESIIKQSDFPITLKQNISNPTGIKNSIFYLISSDGKTTELTSTKPINNNDTWWLKPPAPGKYELYSQNTNWNDTMFKSPSINLEIKK